MLNSDLQFHRAQSILSRENAIPNKVKQILEETLLRACLNSSGNFLKVLLKSENRSIRISLFSEKLLNGNSFPNSNQTAKNDKKRKNRATFLRRCFLYRRTVFW